MDPLLQHITDYAIVCDADGEIEFVNPALLAALGYDASESVGNPLLDEPARAALQQAVRDMAGDSAARSMLQISCRKNNGESLDLVGRLVPSARDGAFVGFFAEQQPKRGTGQQLEAILEAIPDVLLILDRDGRYRHIFTANDDLLVGERDELLGKTIQEVVPEEEARPGLDLLAKVIENRRPAEGIHMLTIKDQPRWFSVRVVPVEDEGEDCALWLSRDVTETVLARKKQAANRDLLQELLRIQERERQLLACELHDGFVQDVVGARMWLESVEHEWKDAPKIAQEALHVVRTSIDQAVTKSRELVNSLRPVLTDHSGIEAGIGALVEQFDRQTETNIIFSSTGDVGPLFPLLESAIIRICQEALKNVVRHSQAKVATVEIARQGEMVRLVIDDDGVGFDPDEKVREEAFGVEAIIRRAEVFGGQARMQTAPGKGTKIGVTLPALALDADVKTGTEKLSSIMLNHAELKVTGDSPDAGSASD